MKKLIKYSGFALVVTGFLFAIPNTVILPFVDFKVPFSELLISTSFFYRMLFAALTVLFLLFGVFGIYLHHSNVERMKWFREIAFFVTFLGSAFMLANEWHQIFILPEVAQINPDVVDKLGSSDPSNRFSIGAMIALFGFSN